MQIIMPDSICCQWEWTFSGNMVARLEGLELPTRSYRLLLLVDREDDLAFVAGPGLVEEGF